MSYTFLFRKIKSGVFPVPDYLNRSVVNLLCHMLQTGRYTYIHIYCNIHQAQLSHTALANLNS